MRGSMLAEYIYMQYIYKYIFIYVNIYIYILQTWTPICEADQLVHGSFAAAAYTAGAWILHAIVDSRMRQFSSSGFGAKSVKF